MNYDRWMRAFPYVFAAMWLGGMLLIGFKNGWS
jgi:hypothetical protein